MVDRVLQHARDRAVVFGRDEEDRVGVEHFPPQPQHGLGQRLRVVVVQRQVVDADAMEGEARRRQRLQGAGQLRIDGTLADAADDHADVEAGHSGPGHWARMSAWWMASA